MTVSDQDPGAAAPRRSFAGRLALPLVLVAAGLLLATTARSAGGSTLHSTSHDRLADLVRQQQQQLTAARADQQRLSAEIEALSAQRAAANGAVAPVRAQGAALQGPVGLLPVHGPSLTVSLDDAPRNAPVAAGYPAPQPDDLVVHQQDVQAVVNALWAGGAEAMTIMGQRVISTSAVRCVGNTLLLQGRVYSPPFVVSAIGDQSRMASALRAAPGVRVYEQYVKAYGLRLGTSRSGDTRLPGYDGPITLTHAQPLGAP
ncbi:MAG TPA: DUF881 domain-containing protein [Mycobacteriales bacterium]|jgi:uncharacterized protein YlxW (UPF0749 family)|nr:DUF881 domain-containing protein [Mycobacteriales bacterium]